MRPTPDAIAFWLIAGPSFALAALVLYAPFEVTERGRRIAARLLRAVFGELPE